MHDMWMRVVDHMADRIGGPMTFRLVLQPIMAAFFAIRSGLADAKAGRLPYFWSLIRHPELRPAMIKDGWRSVGRVFVFALVMDTIYQIIVLEFVYPGEMVFVAFVLAIVPYLILRGLTTRIARGLGVPRTSAQE